MIIVKRLINEAFELCNKRKKFIKIEYASHYGCSRVK